MDAFISLARTNAGLITVVGALIVFFSWIVNNALKTNYVNLTNAIDSAERDSRLYAVLAELRGSINSVASELVQPRLLERAAAEDARNTPASRYAVAQAEFSRVLLSAQQVRECNEFCGRELRFSNAHSTETAASKKLRQAAVEISALYENFSEKRSACEAAMFRVVEAKPDERDTAFEAATVVLNDFVAKTRDDVIPQVKPICERAASASNQRRQELADIEERTRQWATRFARISVWLYIIGSALALFGQILDKTKPAT